MGTNAGRGERIGDTDGRMGDVGEGMSDTRGTTDRPGQPADLKERAVRGVQQLAGRAESTARTRLDERKRDTAFTLSSVATTLLQSGAQLRDEQQAVAGEYIERAARQVERAATYLQDVDLGEVVDNVEDFARKRPAVFVGAAFALGIVAARFLKSSRRPPHALMERQVRTPVTVEPGLADRSPEWQEQS
jgi:hypothetical protein